MILINEVIILICVGLDEIIRQLFNVYMTLKMSIKDLLKRQQLRLRWRLYSCCRLIRFHWTLNFRRTRICLKSTSLKGHLSDHPPHTPNRVHPTPGTGAGSELHQDPPTPELLPVRAPLRGAPLLDWQTADSQWQEFTLWVGPTHLPHTEPCVTRTQERCHSAQGGAVRYESHRKVTFFVRILGGNIQGNASSLCPFMANAYLFIKGELQEFSLPRSSLQLVSVKPFALRSSIKGQILICTNSRSGLFTERKIYGNNNTPESRRLSDQVSGRAGSVFKVSTSGCCGNHT